MNRFQGAIDVSVAVTALTPVYPGDPPVEIRRLMEPGPSNAITLSHLSLTPHSGTHLDFPRHFFPAGKWGADYGVKEFTFRAAVLDATPLAASGRHIDEDFLRSSMVNLPGADAILFRTHDGSLWESGKYQAGYTAIAPSGAEWLARIPGLRLVGIDYLSVDPHDADPMAAHLGLLGDGKLLLECLDLGSVGAGQYDLVCPPVRWIESEAAPCRAILLPR